jgi:hypothetical protein
MPRPFPYFLAILISLACAGPSYPAGQPQPRGTQGGYVEGQVIVEFKEDATKEEIETVRRDLHLQIIRTFSRPNLYLMRICDHTPVKTVLESLRRYPAVLYAEPDFEYTMD